MNTKAATDVDSYLAGIPDTQRAALEALRHTIRAETPDAVESISYGIPTFKYRGKPLVYFAALKGHCALYALPVEAFRSHLAGYDVGDKGTIRFQPERPPPDTLVRSMLRARVAEIEASVPERKQASNADW
jgi:uncharacterized protein YdhG (YjbR/CyaY superfamily)